MAHYHISMLECHLLGKQLQYKDRQECIYPTFRGESLG